MFQVEGLSPRIKMKLSQKRAYLLSDYCGLGMKLRSFCVGTFISSSWQLCEADTLTISVYTQES